MWAIQGPGGQNWFVCVFYEATWLPLCGCTQKKKKEINEIHIVASLWLYSIKEINENHIYFWNWEHASHAPPQEHISSCLDRAALNVSSCIHKYPLFVGSFAAAAVGHHECQEPFKITKFWLYQGQWPWTKLYILGVRTIQWWWTHLHLLCKKIGEE